MKITRATFAVPEPRTPYIGLDLEEPLKLSFAGGTLAGFVARYDQVDASGTARRIVSTAFEVPLSSAEYGQLATICAAALARAGVVPPGVAWSVVEVP